MLNLRDTCALNCAANSSTVKGLNMNVIVVGNPLVVLTLRIEILKKLPLKTAGHSTECYVITT